MYLIQDQDIFYFSGKEFKNTSDLSEVYPMSYVSRMIFQNIVKEEIDEDYDYDDDYAMPNTIEYNELLNKYKLDRKPPFLEKGVIQDNLKDLLIVQIDNLDYPNHGIFIFTDFENLTKAITNLKEFVIEEYKLTNNLELSVINANFYQDQIFEYDGNKKFNGNSITYELEYGSTLFTISNEKVEMNEDISNSEFKNFDTNTIKKELEEFFVSNEEIDNYLDSFDM